MTHATPLTQTEFINIHGDKMNVGILPLAKPKRPVREKPAEFHNGWRVVGHPPGALEEACKQYAAEIANIERHNSNKPPSSRVKMPPPWDERKWLQKTKKRPVRSKPYEVPEAARECMALAIKAGWLCVDVVEMKKTKDD